MCFHCTDDRLLSGASMKSEIRRKTVGSVTDEETKDKWLRRGREGARASFIKKLAAGSE